MQIFKNCNSKIKKIRKKQLKIYEILQTNNILI